MRCSDVITTGEQEILSSTGRDQGNPQNPDLRPHPESSQIKNCQPAIALSDILPG